MTVTQYWNAIVNRYDGSWTISWKTFLRSHHCPYCFFFFFLEIAVHIIVGGARRRANVETCMTFASIQLFSEVRRTANCVRSPLRFTVGLFVDRNVVEIFTSRRGRTCVGGHTIARRRRRCGTMIIPLHWRSHRAHTWNEGVHGGSDLPIIQSPKRVP